MYDIGAEAPHQAERPLAEPAYLAGPRVAVVIPCYRVSPFILDVIARIGPEVTHIFVVDDRCPESSGALVEAECNDPRVKVIYHEVNQGVGGATLTGYAEAVQAGADAIIKLDGDGQMDPALIPRFVAPLLNGDADYTKGNRFFYPHHLQNMPLVRALGNAALSFMTKASSGYWDIMDPTNGFTCIHGRVARELLKYSISSRYFFESDVLFRLNTFRAVVQDVPMASHYGDETSSLRIGKVIPEFLAKHARNLAMRLFYNYLLRNFTVATLEFVVGLFLLMGGAWFGACEWYRGVRVGVAASGGTVMLAALPVLVGIQLLLAAIGYDIQTVPSRPVHSRL